MHSASARPSTPTPLPGARRTTSSLSSQLAASLPPSHPAIAPPASAAHADKKLLESQTNRMTTAAVAGTASAPFTPRRLNFPGRLSLQMPSRGPLSPVLDPALGYSVARRPRLDFARACTSLHHSTLAEQPSPDSSPLNHTCFPIPRNNSNHNKGSDSPIASHHGGHHSSSHASSLGSTCMLDYAPSVDGSGSSSDEDLDVDLDFEFNTPTTPAMSNNESAASISLRNHQKARLGARGRSRHSSNSSASASNSSLASPSPTTPPVQLGSAFTGGYFGRPQGEGGGRRKESLSQVLRSSFKIGKPGGGGGGGGSMGLFGGTASEDEKDRPDPIRRPVSRRGSLLPKTKNFQRIKAALIEEASPLDMEVKREAEITRQIRDEEDNSPPPGPANTQDAELSDIREEDEGMSYGDSNKGIGISFSKQAQRHGGFWFGDQMEGLGGSPPTFPGLRMSTDGDIMMNSESVVNSPVANMPAEMRRAKRRRTQDERFEPNVFKRRAVSPGLSGSPILAASPPLGGGGGGKRLNFQGMSDTHDAIMKMSLQ
ncbi:unnamed protein product [Tuber melanosporum]|uniref:(Perigord truffle) hypothetical protein n=1 Tax=Tuber melanosporum (strain Mel28) TaxID=656061 RepID=D5GFK0_TUBMM|nr:uncharacterized protein GSTUM_00006943001 [Tuber melanosporum]CAZ83293.1 unnamed protein product [Tuber melanosporum]